MPPAAINPNIDKATIGATAAPSFLSKDARVFLITSSARACGGGGGAGLHPLDRLDRVGAVALGGGGADRAIGARLRGVGGDLRIRIDDLQGRIVARGFAEAGIDRAIGVDRVASGD